jgi:iron complex transport system permease protein
MKKEKNILLFAIFGVILLFLFVTNICLGSISIPIADVFNSIMGKTASKTSWEFIIFDYRLPKAITAVLVGMALSISGLLMQTLFKNPLAGPYVLGLSSGASLGVAFVVLGSSFLPTCFHVFLNSAYSLIFAAILGSSFVFVLVLLVSKQLKDTAAILIVGLMFGSFAGAIVSTLTYFSTAEQLQRFTFWSLGSLGNLGWDALLILSVVVAVGLLLSFFTIKSLNSLLLGENYAQSQGLNVKKVRLQILVATSILTGSVTAFVGPIAFVGLAVPHLSKLVFKTSNHLVLFGATLLFGAIILLACDILSQFPNSGTVLPINAITAIIGAPVVVVLLLKKKQF